jgi:hypothetical protein
LEGFVCSFSSLLLLCFSFSFPSFVCNLNDLLLAPSPFLSPSFSLVVFPFPIFFYPYLCSF